MKNLILLICFSVLFFSCEKQDESGDEREYTFNRKILDGYNVTSIAFDSKGNAWVGTYNQGLIKYSSKETVVYDNTNSNIPLNTFIQDIAVDSKDNIWIGCDGLIKYDGNTFTKFTTTNSPIPVDHVISVAVDTSDNIWFSSCYSLEGGVVKYDGTNFTVFTPDNSVLPEYLIKSIAIDKNNNVWLASSKTVGYSYVVKISNTSDMTVYSDSEFGFSPYYLGNIQINSKNQPCCAISYIWGEPHTSERPQVFTFDGTTSVQLQFDDKSVPKYILVDNEDKIWCSCLFGVIAIFDGQRWHIDNTQFKEVGAGVIKQSPDNKIWIATGEGIYIND